MTIFSEMLKGIKLNDARRELAQIFKSEQDDLCEDDSAATQRALALLKEFPELAQEEFEATEDVNFRFLPLGIFVTSGAGLAVIETVHKLYPKAVSTKHPELKFYPLQAACEIHADLDVIEFLAVRYPKAIDARDCKGNLIIHSVLSQSMDDMPRRRTIERLLELYPECSGETNNKGECPLAIAFQAEQSIKVLDKIIQKRLQQNIRSFEIVDWKDYEMGAKEVSRLAMELLPKLELESFRCEPATYTDSGFNYLMEYLQEDQTIKTLSLAIPPLIGGSKGNSFLEFFRHNITVQHLTLSRNVAMWSTSGGGMDVILQAQGLNPALKSLELSGLFLMSSFELAFLIAKAPQKLVVNNIMVCSKWTSSHIKQWGTSLVTDLTLRNIKMRGKCLDKIVDNLKSLPALKSLTLDFTLPEDKHDETHLNGRDLTKTIMSLLKHGKLESLVLQGLYIDIRKVSCKLNKNKKLRKLHIDALRSDLPMTVGCLVGTMLEDNWTLEDIKFHVDYNVDETQRALDGSQVVVPKFEYVEDPAIKFYTRRNRDIRKMGGKREKKEKKKRSKIGIDTAWSFRSKPKKDRSVIHNVLTY